MAKIVIPDKYWNGSEEITFKVEDPDGGKTWIASFKYYWMEGGVKFLLSRARRLLRLQNRLAPSLA